MNRFIRNTGFYLLIFLVTVGIVQFFIGKNETAKDYNYNQLVQTEGKRGGESGPEIRSVDVYVPTSAVDGCQILEDPAVAEEQIMEGRGPVERRDEILCLPIFTFDKTKLGIWV